MKLFASLLLGLSFALTCGLSLACEVHRSDTETPAQKAAAAATPSVSQTEITTMDGIRFEDVTVGGGKEARLGDTVSVNYLGTLMNGQKFDSSYDRNEPFEFTLGEGRVIEGWEKGIAGMKVGGKRILTIPPEKAYGKNGAPPVIPPDATLKFEVELLDIE